MAHLGIFAKYWQPGHVKTRLAARLGDPLAAKVYLLFLEHLTDSLSKCCQQRTLVFSPLQYRASFELKFGNAWGYQAQAEGGLGNRLSQFFGDPTNTPADGKLIVIGSDTPNLSCATIQQAEEWLDQWPVVLGPSKDGGYYLIGMNTELSPAVAELFEGIPWSTDRVLKETRNRLESAKVPYSLLPVMCDVDDVTGLSGLLVSLNDSQDSADRRLRERIQNTVSASYFERSSE